MATRGRKPLPTAVKILEGDRGKGRRPLNRKEPVPNADQVKCPSWLMPEAKKEWNEVYLSTYADNQMNTVGWVKPTRETYNKYGWNYPVTASYISMMNVDVVDDRGVVHSVDIDPRVYLQLLGKKVSIAKD